MTETKLENFDESLLKCKKLNLVVPSVVNDIRKIEKLDERLENDLNLKLAERLLVTLGELSLEGENAKETYVNTYRDMLTLGLNTLKEFMTAFNELDFLTEKQRKQLGSIAANILVHQQSIIKIVTH